MNIQPVKACLILLSSVSFLMLTSCSTPKSSQLTYICQPYYSADLTQDPTLDAKNFPIPRTGKIETAQVGDTAIQRYLSARYPSGKVILKDKLLAPYPQTIGFDVDWSLEKHIQGRLNRNQIETLSETRLCQIRRSIGNDDKTLTSGGGFDSKINAAAHWMERLETTEPSDNALNTLLQPQSPHDLSLYKVKNYKGAAMWLFKSPISMSLMSPVSSIRHNQNTAPAFQAVGVWAQDSGHHMLAVRKFTIDREGKLLSEEYLLMPSPSIEGIEVETTDHIVPWDSDESFFDQRLIYNGLSGSIVKFLYREFSGYLNRSSFEQEVTYDLNIGEVIGFKSARFRILSASNTGIEYEVLNPFDKDAVYRTQKTY